MQEVISSWVFPILELLAALFLVGVGCLFLYLVILYVVDRTQTAHAVRRNFPVIGRFRYFFEKLGEYFRQYFFAMDREELPFNRAQRSWVYRAAKNVPTTVGFGSTKNIRLPGSVVFINCPFPTLDEQNELPSPIVFGPQTPNPYSSSSLFNISGMSYGAISKPAVKALSNGAKKAGIWLNTGEGGLSPFHLEGHCDVVFQVGTAKYGVRDENGNLSTNKIAEIAKIPQVKMIEIKLSQGAKPGKGGILPGGKVTKEIANIRGIPAGSPSISPNRHLDVNSPEELLNLIHTIRETAQKPVGFKCVLGAYGWLDQLCKLIVKRGEDSAPDFITLDSGDGGTGAAPAPLIDNVGLPISETLPQLVNLLLKYNLKSRIRVICSGKMVNPAEIAWAYCIGADSVVSARGFMFALGCIQALQCHQNTCPTGITTHNKRLQRGLIPKDKAQRVSQYAARVHEELQIIAHSCGVPEPRRLRRYHARLVGPDGASKTLDELYGPGEPPKVKPASAA